MVDEKNPTPEVPKVSPEIQAIMDKTKAIQEQYNGLIKTKNNLLQQLKRTEEDIQKKAGAYQSLMELKVELENKKEPLSEEEKFEAEEDPKKEA